MLKDIKSNEKKDIMKCKHIERYTRNGRVYCIDCKKEIKEVEHGEEIETKRINRKGGIVIKSEPINLGKPYKNY